MQTVPLVSSNLQSCSYDDVASELYVTFNHGGRYKYSGVPSDVYEGLADASSPGSFFQSEIKGQYGYSKA